MIPALRTIDGSRRSTVLLVTVCMVTGCSHLSPDSPTEPEPQSVAFVRGRVVTVDGAPASGVSVAATWGTIRGTTSTGGDGAFEVGLSEVPTGVGAITFLPETPDLLEAWVPLAAAAMSDSLRLVLLPARWTITAGAYEGTAVDIHPADAADATGVAPSYWGFSFPFRQVGPVQTIVDSTSWGGDYSSWRPQDLPMAVALDHAAETITAADSAELWKSLRTLEDTLGRSLFAPARLEDLPDPDPDVLGLVPGALVVALDSTLAHDGIRGETEEGSYGATWLRSEDVSAWSGGRVTHMGVVSLDIAAARIRIRDAEALRDHALVMHEAMHALGVEHGCVWPSLQTYVEICPALRSDVPTAQDVAYLEVLEHTRAEEEIMGTTLGLLPAVWGERVLRRGLSPLPDAG